MVINIQTILFIENYEEQEHDVFPHFGCMKNNGEVLRFSNYQYFKEVNGFQEYQPTEYGDNDCHVLSSSYTDENGMVHHGSLIIYNEVINSIYDIRPQFHGDILDSDYPKCENNIALCLHCTNDFKVYICPKKIDAYKNQVKIIKSKVYFDLYCFDVKIPFKFKDGFIE